MNRQCLSDFLHIPAVVSGNFSAIGMFSHGNEKINMSFPFSADHGEIIIFHVAAAFPHDSHILPYGHRHHMIVRYHMKLSHPAKAIIEIQGRFRFSAFLRISRNIFLMSCIARLSYPVLSKIYSNTKYSIMQSLKHMIMYFQNKPVFMKDCRF